MSALAPTLPAEWKAPSEDGQLLIWPDAGQIIEQTRANHDYLAKSNASLMNLPLRELRDAVRKWLGHSDDRPLIATGHQVELYHAGVWAKHVLINALAAKLDGSAVHFAVDTDAPKHLHLRWPGGSSSLTDDPRLSTAAWSGLLESPTPAHVDAIRGQFDLAASKWNFRPLLPQFLSSMKRLSADSGSLAQNLTNGIHALDWQLGLRYHAMTASPIWQSPGYLLFAAHVLSRAADFASIYNSTLAEYRRLANVRNPTRPWPDLKLTGDQCEVPFWCDDLAAQTRVRAYVEPTASGAALSIHGESIELDRSANGWALARRFGQFLAAHSLRLSPRALTLTVFLRLCAADQFVHGIGGGRYDQVTDRVIRSFIGIDPPAFSVTTATLLFPMAASQKLVDIRALRLEGRRLRHGWADPAKRQLARRIAGLPRKSPQRRQLYTHMHESLAAAIKDGPYADWRRRWNEVQHLHSQQARLFDRELFFAIQSESRLKTLAARYHDRLT